MADITPIASLNGEIAPTAALAGELAMPEKVWMQGPPGVAATVTVGTVTTGGPGTDAIVTNSGTENAAVLDFTIPKGENGVGVPDGGTAGQLLSKTESGTAWIDPPQSGVQPDWNQNDETQPDYVKNRPFYSGPVETVIVEESTGTFTESSGGVYMAEFPPFKATVGEIYNVRWDGTAYECTCADFNGNSVIGNLSILGAGSDTGEPFLMPAEGGIIFIIFTLDTSASHTFSISEFVEEGVKKIDRKYLPEAAVITHVASTNTYSSDLTYDELHEVLLDHRQVVFWEPENNMCSYLTKWVENLDGSISLAFAGGSYSVSLNADGSFGTIVD